MKNIVFIAPPAAGKGTQSDLLVNKYDYNHVSTGDLLRAEVASGSELGKKLDSLLKTGELINDDVVKDLLIKALSESDKPFILDGYPRNEKQIKDLEIILETVNKKVDVVIYLDVPFEIACQRATGRLICKNCGKSFHKFFAKPLVDGVCDDCHGNLISRSDDTEETFKVRYDTYLTNTKPLLDYFKRNNLLKVVDKVDTPLDTFSEIEKILSE